MHEARIVELWAEHAGVVHTKPLPEIRAWPQVVVWQPKGAKLARYFLPQVPGRRTDGTGAQVGRYVEVPPWLITDDHP